MSVPSSLGWGLEALPQSLPRRELRGLARRDHDILTRRRIPALTACPCQHRKPAESYQAKRLPAAEHGLNTLHERIHYLFRLALGHPGLLYNSRHELGFSHQRPLSCRYLFPMAFGSQTGETKESPVRGLVLSAHTSC